MSKYFLTALALTIFGLNAQASRILDCTTLGGKSIKIQYGFNGTNTVLEDLQIEGKSATSQVAQFSFSRSGMNLRLTNGSMFIEENGRVNQANSEYVLFGIQCKISDTSQKPAPKEQF